MFYFAYGSNMSLARLRERVPSALPLGCGLLKNHDLRFHKSSTDGSAKCDAFSTDDEQDIIYGALFNISPAEKPSLDRAEGLGYGYAEKEVTIMLANSEVVSAITYIAITIDKSLQPYSWYVQHVLIGAQETSLPKKYIQVKIQAIETHNDQNKQRDANERAIHSL